MIQREGGGNLRSSLLFSLSVAIWNADPRGILSLPPLFLPFSSRIGMTFANAEEFRAGMEFSKGKTEGRPSLCLSHRTRFKLGGFRPRVSSCSANSEEKRTHLLFARPGCIAPQLFLSMRGEFI